MYLILADVELLTLFQVQINRSHNKAATLFV